MKKEYIIIGDNNFWYASCLSSIKEAKAELKVIKKNLNCYGCPHCDSEPCCKPTEFYIYEAKEI